MNRRQVIICGGAGAMTGVGAAVMAQNYSAWLRLVRKPGWQNQCVNCIPGEIFAMDEAVPRKLTDAVELSFELNTPSASSIPLGVYSAFVRTDRTKNWMNTDDKAWRLELENVPGGRTRIQFHHGQDSGWSKGCMIVGQQLQQACVADPCRFPDSPVAAIAAIRNYVMPRLVSSSDRVKIEIIA